MGVRRTGTPGEKIQERSWFLQTATSRTFSRLRWHRCNHRSAKDRAAQVHRDNVDVRLLGTERQRRRYARNANEKCTESRDVDNEGSGAVKGDRRPLSRCLSRPRFRDHSVTRYLRDALEPEDGSHPERHRSVACALGACPGISTPSTERPLSGNGESGQATPPPLAPPYLPPAPSPPIASPCTAHRAENRQVQGRQGPWDRLRHRTGTALQRRQCGPLWPRTSVQARSGLPRFGRRQLVVHHAVDLVPREPRHRV